MRLYLELVFTLIMVFGSMLLTLRATSKLTLDVPQLQVRSMIPQDCIEESFIVYMGYVENFHTSVPLAHHGLSDYLPPCITNGIRATLERKVASRKKQIRNPPLSRPRLVDGNETRDNNKKSTRTEQEDMY